jgi:cell division protein DivIC
MPQSHVSSPTGTRSIGARRRLRILVVVVLGLFVWASLTVFAQMNKFHERTAQIGTLKMKLAETQKINEEAKREIARLNDNEYKEEKARKELHLAKPGETVFDVSRLTP